MHICELHHMGPCTLILASEGCHHHLANLASKHIMLFGVTAQSLPDAAVDLEAGAKGQLPD